MSKSMRWIALGAVLVVLLGALGVLQACDRSSGGDDSEPRAGGAVEVADATPEALTTQPAPSATPYVFAEGEIYTAAAELPIFASAASSSTVLEVYAPGAEFVVLEPNGDFIEYPVTSGGASWVRVRAGDGLAGWAKAEAFGR